MLSFRLGLVCLVASGAACGDLSPAADAAPASSAALQALRYELDFNAPTLKYGTGFADYPLGAEGFFELRAEELPMPAPLQGRGLMLSGNNHSDDLLMYLAVPIEGVPTGPVL